MKGIPRTSGPSWASLPGRRMTSGKSASLAMPRAAPQAGPSTTPTTTGQRHLSTSSRSHMPRLNKAAVAPPAGPSQPVPSSLREAAIRTVSPERSHAAVPSYLRNLQNHLFTSFLPENQPCTPVVRSPKAASEDMSEAGIPESIATPFGQAVVMPMSQPPWIKHDQGDTSSASSSSSSPAPVLALVTPYEGGECYISAGLEQVAASVDADVQHIDLTLALSYRGASAPVPGAPILAKNPLRDQMNRASGQSQQEHSMPIEMEEGDEDEDGPRIGVMRLPFMPQHPHHQSQPAPTVNAEWVDYFTRLLAPESSSSSSSSRRRRIIHLESSGAMSSTFGAWYPSFMEAVHRRRRGAHSANKQQKTKKELLFPTTVVLSCSPSLLPAHTASAPAAQADSMRSMLESVAARFGAKMSAERESDMLWWGGDEVDHEAREQRDEARVRSLNENGPYSLVPKLHSDRVISFALPIVPAARDPDRERADRIRRRAVVNAAQVAAAVAKFGAELEEPLAILRYKGWDEVTMTSSEAEQLASSAIGRKLHLLAVEEARVKQPLKLRWSDIEAARVVEPEVPSYAAPGKPLLLSDDEAATRPSVIEQVKKAKDLSTYEKKLLGSIVDASKLNATSFKDVHLPEKTIDAIRTLIQLPLLFPDAFRGGILKDHATGGALLFGPPGTGKTLLARAVASESGANMITIQPSDINNMYVGESEKLVKAAFSLARRLSPCVIFLDEVDSLFGARASRDAGAGNRAHNSVLTEFMQEMDGLTSAIANKDKQIVVIGATNRPFDLDDAVLRRLPRRILVDLPDQKGRKAILEILLREEKLADDVSLDKIVQDTDGFSGSDLKHLCVSAALAAIKDTVEVPWRKGRSVVPSSPSLSHPRSSPRRDPQLVIPQHQQQAKQEEGEILAPIQATTSTNTSSTRTVQNRHHGTILSSPTVIKRFASSRGSSKHSASAETSGLVERVIGAKHFQAALLEVRPSTTEEGTLPELRRWAEQFGEGGTRKNRKKGFGKGFGFGSAEQPSTYGRVTEQD